MQYLLNNDGRSVKTVMDNTRKTYIRKYVDIIELDHNLWVINELGKTHIFLINGARRALLIDTGLGIADLPEIVRRLCGRKPVIVVNTHSHGDHNSGNWMFDTVFVDRFDEPYALRVMGTRERELSRHAYFSDAIKAGFNFEGWRPRPAERIRSIREGCSIDIGNYCLDVIEIPSHTAGSIALYEKTKGWLFPGDVLLEWETWGHLTSGVLAPSVSLMEYLRSLQKLKELTGGAACLYPSHGRKGEHAVGCTEYMLPVSVMDIYIKGLFDVIENKAEISPYPCAWEDGYVSYFPIGGVVFQKNRIH